MKMNVTESFHERSDFFQGMVKISVNGYHCDSAHRYFVWHHMAYTDGDLADRI
jgi:hypothetical protein